MKAIVLAGGFGTRLRELIPNLPKPMAPVAGRPFLEYVLDRLIVGGVREITLSVGYQAKIIMDHFGYAYRNASVDYAVETEPLGTGGAIAYALQVKGDAPVLVLNGDTFLDINYGELIGWYEQAPSKVAMVLREVPDVSRYGSVLATGELVTGFMEKGNMGLGMINAGVYIIQPEVFKKFKLAGRFSLEDELLQRYCVALTPRAYKTGAYFIDIGIPDDYERAQIELPKVVSRPAVFFDRDGVLNHDNGYTHRIEDFRWTDGARAAIKMLNDRGWLVFVVTNQAGVARGYYDEVAVHTLHTWMQEDLARIGAHIDDFRYCPHHPEGTVERYSIFCGCRKPAPGMIASLLNEWSIDIKSSILIGDKSSDLKAASVAKIAAIKYKGDDLHDILLNYLNDDFGAS
jgi:D,D-heptose 1,7-bisphosphate phosphatase